MFLLNAKHGKQKTSTVLFIQQTKIYKLMSVILCNLYKTDKICLVSLLLVCPLQALSAFTWITIIQH